MSAVLWAPNKPKHWDGASLRWVADIFAGGTPDKGNLGYWTDGTIPWLNSGSVGDWIINEPSKYITKDAYSNSSAKWIPSRSVVIALAGQGKTKGTAARLEIDSTCNQSMAAIVPSNSLDYRFLQFWLASNYQNIRNLAGGDKRDGLNLAHIGGIQVPLPPVDEQRSISDYLDRETQKIDELIAEQRELIETLENRRQATIEASVFALGVETVRIQRTEPWLPSLPATWKVKQLGFVAKTQAGYAFQSERFKHDGSGTRLLRGINVKPEGVDWSDRVTWDEVVEPISEEYELRAGDVVLGMDRPFVGSGIRVTSIKESDLPALLVQRVLSVRATGEMREGYLRYLLGTSSLKHYLEPLFTGVSVPHISEWQVRKFVVPVPPTKDQIEIAHYLDEQTSRIDELISESEGLIALSQERRAALITAAVTGQIDVRTTS